MLNYFIEPQSKSASPFEEVGDILDALHEIGRGAEADQLLARLADEQGFDLAPRLPVVALVDATKSIAELAVECGREMTEAGSAAVLATRTGDPRDVARFEREAGEAVRAAHGLTGAVTRGRSNKRQRGRA